MADSKQVCYQVGMFSFSKNKFFSKVQKASLKAKWVRMVAELTIFVPFSELLPVLQE
jgi:hypothetical protein